MHKKVRKLTLSSETLRSLNQPALEKVAGGMPEPTNRTAICSACTVPCTACGTRC